MVGKKRSSQGRRKIAIEKIVNEEARHVCFSKRRNGVFTKAADLTTLCGAQVAIIVESPAGNPYTFGSPEVNEVFDRYLAGDNSTDHHLGSPSSMSLIPVNHTSLESYLNQQCMEVSQQVDRANAKKSHLEAIRKNLVENNQICQLAEDIETLGLADLQLLEQILVGFKVEVDAKLRETMRGGGASSSNAIIPANPTTTVMNRFSYGVNYSGYFARNFDYGRRFFG